MKIFLKRKIEYLTIFGKVFSIEPSEMPSFFNKLAHFRGIPCFPVGAYESITMESLEHEEVNLTTEQLNTQSRIFNLLEYIVIYVKAIKYNFLNSA